jgi:hypothetical protein
MKGVETGFGCSATADRVWRILTDFAAWGDWNPIIPEITADGPLAPGTRLRIVVALPKRPRRRYEATIVRFEPGHEICWRGHVYHPLYFVAEHAFRVEPRADGGCRVRHREDIGGAMSLLMGRPTQDMMREGLTRIDIALAKRIAALYRPDADSP